MKIIQIILKGVIMVIVRYFNPGEKGTRKTFVEVKKEIKEIMNKPLRETVKVYAFENKDNTIKSISFHFFNKNGQMNDALSVSKATNEEFKILRNLFL